MGVCHASGHCRWEMLGISGVLLDLQVGVVQDSTGSGALTGEQLLLAQREAYVQVVVAGASLGPWGCGG